MIQIIVFAKQNRTKKRKGIRNKFEREILRETDTEDRESKERESER